MTLRCTFRAIDAGARCGAIELQCADGQHVVNEVCTVALARGGVQEIRVSDFSPPLEAASAECTRIRFTPFGRGYEPNASPAPPVSAEEVDAEVAALPRSGQELAAVRARCAQYMGAAARPSEYAPAECQALFERGRKRAVLPPKLSRETVRRVMKRNVEPRVRQCSDAVHWRAVVRVELAGTGDVRAVEVLGDFAQTAVAQCIEDALLTTRFPAMKAPSLKFRYTFAF